MAASFPRGPMASGRRATAGDPLFQIFSCSRRRRLVQLFLLFIALAVQWPTPETVEAYERADGVDAFGESTSQLVSQEHCLANSSTCRSHQFDGETASFFEGEKEGGTHAVKLTHASSIPEFGFFEWKDAQRSNKQHVPSKALHHAVKEAFYAYPLYEDNAFKIHVHRKGQKQLISDLHQAGVFDLHADEAAGDEWSLMQSLARSYKEGAEEDDAGDDAAEDRNLRQLLSSTLAPLTYSLAQSRLDLQCQTLLQMEKRAVARVVEGEVYCFKMAEIDLAQEGRCLDACLFEFDCPGAPDAQAQQLKLEFSRLALLHDTCTTSPLQLMASQHFCGDSSVFRMTNEEIPTWVCIAPSEEYKIHPSLECFNLCGSLTPCISPVGPVVLSGKAEHETCGLQ
ncbi:hypothetical protein Emag_002737 [Eimeria magna]